MKKTKGQKILYSVFTVILAILLGVILLNRFGIVDFESEINKVRNPDFYWQSEPFGDINAVFYLESKTEKNGDHYSVFYYLKSADGSKEYTHGDGIPLKELRNYSYKDISHLYELYSIEGICYTAMFVPLDCQIAEINGEQFETKTGFINTPEGELEFRYFTAQYKTKRNNTPFEQDTLILYTESGRTHKFVENIYD